MKKNDLVERLNKLDDLFSTEEERIYNNAQKIVDVNLSEIDSFENHPFKVNDNDELFEMADSIRESGVLVPAIIRPKNGRYEMISGHRRKRASEIAGKTTMPCIIRELTDDEATIIMVDSNMQREKILPSERAFAYKMKLEAIKHQGKKDILTLRPVVDKFSSAELVGKEFGESGRQVQRYIRLTELIPDILKFVDNNVLGNTPSIALRPAVEISFLSKEEQTMLSDFIECSLITPSLSQTIQLKELSQKSKLDYSTIENILNIEKPNQVQKLKINMNRLRNILPQNLVSEKEKEEFVIKAVEYYCKKQKERHQMER